MSNVGVGHEVRRAGSGLQGETGVVVSRVLPPMPSTTGLPVGEAAHAINVWKGLPSQIAVYWQGGDLVPARVEHLVASEVEFATPHATYRAGDFGFPIFAVETDGYCDLIVRDATGQQIARIDWMDSPETDMGDPDTHRTMLHRAIDAYADEIEKRTAERTAASAVPGV